MTTNKTGPVGIAARNIGDLPVDELEAAPRLSPAESIDEAPERSSQGPSLDSNAKGSSRPTRVTEDGRLVIRSLPEAAALLDIASDNLAAAFGMVAHGRRELEVLETVARAEVTVESVRPFLYRVIGLCEIAQAHEARLAKRLLTFFMTGAFPNEPDEGGDEEDETCS